MTSQPSRRQAMGRRAPRLKEWASTLIDVFLDSSRMEISSLKAHRLSRGSGQILVGPRAWEYNGRVHFSGGLAMTRLSIVLVLFLLPSPLVAQPPSIIDVIPKEAS